MQGVLSLYKAKPLGGLLNKILRRFFKPNTIITGVDNTGQSAHTSGATTNNSVRIIPVRAVCSFALYYL